MTTKVATEVEAAKTTVKTPFNVEGLALLETMETMPEHLKLTAYVFDPGGKLLGSAALDAKGRFNVPVQTDHPADVQLLIGPAGEPDVIRKSKVYRENFSAKDWVPEGPAYHLKPRIFVGKDLVQPWNPLQILVSGHVRTTQGKPIPFAKVEIFDVDREGILWPYLMRWKDQLAYKKVFDIRDLLKNPIPVPHPEPGPNYAEHLGATVPAIENAMGLEAVSLSPQPEPPSQELLAVRKESFVGEMATADPALAQKLAKLTLTSRIPVWDLFTFYSKRLVDTVHTDQDGAFLSCFSFWPFHVRYGRMRIDWRPDIIVRVTQVIDGVEKVLYLDPYTSTRWDVTSTHIDLWLDDLVSGSPGTSERPSAMQTFFTRVGNDEVFDIDQTTGLYHGEGYSNVAYGYTLHFHGSFGKTLSAGAVKRYYKMSYGKGATGSVTAITTPLTDVRVNMATLTGETCFLGPQTINGTMALYEIRDLDHYYWYNPDLLSLWNTQELPDKTGVYRVRLEVFDENGKPLTTVDYRNGTVKPTDPPTELPKVSNCDLILAVQNLAPKVLLEFLNVPKNGVVPLSSVPAIDLKAGISQENGRIFYWGLYYTKGLDLSVTSLPVGGEFKDGIAAAVDQTLSVPVSSLGINSSNTVAFKLWAWSHIRDGYSNYIYHSEQITGIAMCSGLAPAAPALQTP